MAIEKRTSATARFRAARLTVDDLRKLEDELAADKITWRMGAYDKLSTWSWMTVQSASSSLDELIEVAPRGRIYEFKIDAEVGERKFALDIAGPGRRFLALKYDGPGGELPEAYWNINTLLKVAEKRGEKWHYAGVAVAPTLAIFVPVLILDQVARLGWFYNETRPTQDDNIGSAVIWAVVSFLLLASFVVGFWGWSTSSGVTLRPIVDRDSLLNRAIDSVIGAVNWLWSAHKREDLNKQLMLLATLVAAVCGAGSFVVSLLK